MDGRWYTSLQGLLSSKKEELKGTPLAFALRKNMDAIRQGKNGKVFADIVSVLKKAQTISRNPDELDESKQASTDRYLV
jgi:hypothetical protein